MTKRMLPHTAVLYQFIGEVNKTATYNAVLLTHVKHERKHGVNLTDNSARDEDIIYYNSGKNNTGISKAKDVNGSPLFLIPHDEWRELEDKADCFSFSDEGTDYITIGDTIYDDIENVYGKFKIESAQLLEAGNPRNWHYKIIGR